MLQVETIFTKPSTGANIIKSRVQKRNFEVAEGDLLTYLNVYIGFLQSNMDQGYCHKNFLNYKCMKRVVEIRGKLQKMLKNYNIPIVSCNGNHNSFNILQYLYLFIFQDCRISFVSAW